MAKSRNIDQLGYEKVDAGWWGGQNSNRVSLFMQDGQYRFAVNTSNRGGIVQTRPGYHLRLTLPQGNLQGLTSFWPTKSDSSLSQVLVFAVSGKVYYAPFPLTQPASWEPYRLQNIQFDPNAKSIHFEDCQKSVTEQSGTISIVPTYSILMMQDGVTAAAFWDGVTNRHLNESAYPDANGNRLETPTGSFMAWTGERLWVARNDAVLASDLGDPISFIERIDATKGGTIGDFKFDDTITALGIGLNSARSAGLMVFTLNSTSQLQSSILQRSAWSTTSQFQTVLYPNTGCVASKSVTQHNGLIWWYSQGGLVSADSALATYLTSQIKYRDVEMAQSKRNFAPDLSGICCGSFDNTLLVSVPSGDTLNAHTWPLDFSIQSELTDEKPPAWCSVWKGIRPVEWVDVNDGGQRRIFAASVDYMSLNGSNLHIWEAFMPDRMDTIEIIDANGNKTVQKNKIYCSFETKPLGDTMDYKKFRFAEVDCVEIGGEVNVNISFGGTRGGYKKLLQKTLNATIDGSDTGNAEVTALWNQTNGQFMVQHRRLVTQDATDEQYTQGVESDRLDNYDKAFCLFIEWCGRMGIEQLRMFGDTIAESSQGAKIDDTTDETPFNILTNDGVSFKINA